MGQQLPLTRGERLLGVAQREIADNLGDLTDVAGADLVLVHPEAAAPRAGALGDLLTEDGEDGVGALLIHHAAQTELVDAIDGNADDQVVGDDADRQVLDLVTKHGARLDAVDDASAVLGIDDPISDFEHLRSSVLGPEG